jgi:hypothetical protein
MMEKEAQTLANLNFDLQSRQLRRLGKKASDDPLDPALMVAPQTDFVDKD